MGEPAALGAANIIEPSPKISHRRSIIGKARAMLARKKTLGAYLPDSISERWP
jgi:hypothetical protein